MKVIIFLAVVALAAAKPVENEPIKTLRSDFQQQPEGSYEFGFETENGINRQETGVLREALDEENKPHPVVVVKGSYSYTDAAGNQETVNYTADETGYHADGPSIPKVPVPARR